jgi:hypothetical protein
MEELLIDHLELLRRGKVSREEMLRPLEQYPQLGKGAILRRAVVLTNPNSDDTTRQDAHDWLRPFICLTTTYCTSAWPLGRTFEPMTIWQKPHKPSWWITPAFALIFVLIGLTGYHFGMGSNSLTGLGMVGFATVVFYAGMIRPLVMNRWLARKELDENIIRDAQRLEALVEDARRIPV